MTNDESRFYTEEKMRFHQLLNRLNWTEACLLKNEHESLTRDLIASSSTSKEQGLIAQTAQNEVTHFDIVPLSSSAINKIQSNQSKSSNVTDKCNERRRTKYVKRSSKKTFYDVAREWINANMNSTEQDQCEKGNVKKHKKKQRKSRSRSTEHYPDGKKCRKN